MSEVRSGSGSELGASLRNVLDSLKSVFTSEKLEPKEQLFIETMFSVLGRLARADGFVTQEEADHSENLIKTLGLSFAGRKVAVTSFERGRAGLDLDAELTRFLGTYPAHSARARQLFETVVGLAQSDGRMLLPEKAVIRKLAERLQIEEKVVEAVLGVPTPRK